MDEMTLTLNSPITEEQWDMIEDVDFDSTDSITFHTKHGKEVEFVKRKTGKWIDMGDFEQCSVCTGTRLKAVNTVYGKAIWIKSAYCPNCGAKMEVQDE